MDVPTWAFSPFPKSQRTPSVGLRLTVGVKVTFTGVPQGSLCVPAAGVVVPSGLPSIAKVNKAS